MRFINLFNLFLLLSLLLPQPTYAADLYANALVKATSNILTPSQALGAPDNLYADFRASETALTLDMGEEEATGDLTLYFKLFDYGARYQVEFFDADNQKLLSVGDGFPLYVDSVTVSYALDSSYRYVRVTSTNSNEWSLDAVAGSGYLSSTSEASTEPSSSEAEPPTAEDTTGMLVKLADHASVYEIGADGKRHAFPSEDVFYSWYADFNDVTEVDAATMAAYSLGKNVTMRAGTSLVKITTDPKTYAVEPGGVLRWITTEELAESLYGAHWNERVVDVADTFWPNYTVGDDVDAAVHPDGIVIQESTGAFWYIENSNRFQISDDDFAAMDFPSTLLVTNAQSFLDLYVDGGNFELTANLRYPF